MHRLTPFSKNTGPLFAMNTITPLSDSDRSKLWPAKTSSSTARCMFNLLRRIQNAYHLMNLRPLFILLFGLILLIASSPSQAGTVDAGLKLEVIAGPNFVVDSNVESPSTNGPSAAHIGVKITNTGATTLTNVRITAGDLLNPATSTGTAGVFPSRTVTEPGANGYSGTFSLVMPGGALDAVRTVPSLAPGESICQYYFVTYPLKDPSGNSVAGAAPVPEDDLWLEYDMWATAQDGVTTRRVEKTSRATMRNEISAMANKIWPNTDGKVPDEYLDAIASVLGWRPDSNFPNAGFVKQLEGIWYDLGNVGAGFDNDLDGIPDRNIWMQPVGDPARYNPLATRLVKTFGLVIVKLNDGTEQLIPFEDQLYFTNIPGNNTGAVGLVYYQFVPLIPGVTSQLSQYQEVASGFDNEKFNGDYGTAAGSVTGDLPALTFDKTGPATVALGGTITYSVTATNTGLYAIGDPQLSLPFNFQDSIPPGTVYVASSATGSAPANTVSISWSTDNGATFVTTEPLASSVTTVRWTLGAPFSPAATATVGFQVSVPANYSANTVDNTAVAKLGNTGEIAPDSVSTRLTGINTLGDLVWRDDDRDSVKDGGEPGIANILVTLYVDTNNNNAVDSGDILYATTSTGVNGDYLFSNLPDGNFVALVDAADADLPFGYTLPQSQSATIQADLDPTHVSVAAVSNLNVDWPFISALVLDKSTSPTTYDENAIVTYTIDLENHSATVPAKVSPVMTSYATAVGSNRAPQIPANAIGTSNTTYARIDWRASADSLTPSGFTFSGLSGTITKVELLYDAYLEEIGTGLVNDQLQVQVTGTPGLTTNVTTATLDTYAGMAAVRVLDITSAQSSWDLTKLQALAPVLSANKTSAGDDAVLWFDSFAIRVTTSTPPNSSGTYGPNSIQPLPLLDTFDSTRLSFISSSIAPTTVGSGTLTWSDVGPLNPGARLSITLLFRAIAPGTNVSNVASVTNPYFVSGRPANNVTDTQLITITNRGSIGNFVWYDIDADGVQDVGEPGIANVRVSLSNGAQTFTDANGFYLFSGLLDATYDVFIDTTTLPFATFTRTFDPDDANINNRDDFSTVTISGANDNLTQDFGYDTATNALSGSIFRDLNGNGLFGSGDVYLSGITVQLFIVGNGTPVATTTTDVNGYYEFLSLSNSTNYRVQVTQPGSTTNTLDPDLSPGVSGDNQATRNIPAGGGTYIPNLNFAYQPSGALSIGDTLYYDWNGNSTQNSGEGGVPSVDVFLYSDANGDGLIDTSTDFLLKSTTTNSSGVYNFTNLASGDYIVVVSTTDVDFPSGVIQTQDFDGLVNNRAEVNLTVSLTTVDFGYKPVGTGSIGDTVYVDADGNGLKGTTEVGIASVPVTLYRDLNNNGIIDIGSDPVVGVTTTGSSGTYLFTGLPAGDYLVDVDQNAASIPEDAFGYTYGLTTADPHDVTLGSGQTYLAADFGFSAGAYIGDYVYFDTNRNGTQDYSEAGIPNVTVQLFLDVDQDGFLDPGESTPVATTVTANGLGVNPAGFYTFLDVSPGMYIVRVLTSTLPTFGGQPIPQTADPDRDGVPVGDNSVPGLPVADHSDSFVIATLGSSYAGADFGYQPPGVLGDFVWLDLDQDDVQDPGEPGVANVAIVVTNGVTTYNVSTDFDGYWSVANVPDGSWTVTVAASNFAVNGPLEGTTPTYDAEGIPNSVAALTLTLGNVNLPVGNLGIDFGYALNGAYSISGTVLTHDTRTLGTSDDPDNFTDDGTDQDGGPLDEVELEGIIVYLYKTDGTFLGTTTTAADGSYSFGGLPSGSYRVIIGTTTPVLLNSTVTSMTGVNPQVTTVDSTSGTSVIQTLTINTSNVTDVDFTFVSNVNYDYGDLPLSYGITTLTQDGARHIIPNGGSTVYLGAAPDADTNGVATALANGDDTLGSDDENGITLLSPTSWTNGTVASGNGGDIQVSVTGSGWLVGWIDWNHDGSFLDPDEFIVSRAVTTGNTTIEFNIPAGTIGSTSESWLSRFRVFTTEPPFPLFSYTGVATNGEVEDHLIEKPVGASIGDFVWMDDDVDGVLDPEEEGIAGIVVELRNGSNVLIGTQTTSDGTEDVDLDGVLDPEGYYRFRGLPAGTYTVTVNNPPVGHNPTYDENGIVTAHVTTLMLNSGEQHLTADFGYADCVNDWTAWMTLWPLGGQNGPLQDPEGDGTSNLIEYAFCLHPESGLGDPYCMGSEVDGTISLEFSRPTGGAQDVTYALQYSASLGNPTTWQTINLSAIPAQYLSLIVEEDHEMVKISNLEAVTGLSSGTGFVRLRVTLNEGAAPSDATVVSGWTESTLGTFCRTYNNPYLKCPDFSGTVQGVTAQTLDLTNSVGPFDLTSVIESGVAYYVEVVSGENEGHRFDVASVTENGIVLALDSDIYSAGAPFNTLNGTPQTSLISDRLVLRRYWTLGQLFPAADFQGAASQTSADQIEVFAAGVWTNYWLYDNGVTTKWVRVGDGTLADQQDVVIPPGQGVYLNSRNTVGTLLALGQVRSTDFARPLNTGYNLVGGGYPVHQSATTRAMSLGNGFIGGRDFKLVDQFLTWRGDSTPNQAGYVTYYLLDAGAPFQRWVRVGDSTVAARDAEILLFSDQSAMKRASTPRAGYVMPVPWQP